MKDPNIDFYHELVRFTLAHFLENQIPFKAVFFKSQRLMEYLPDFAFNDQNQLIIDFVNWSLETSFIVDETFNCVIVYGENEYPLTMEFHEFIRIYDLTTGISVIGKFFAESFYQDKSAKSAKSAKSDKISSSYEEENKVAIQKSMSGLKLLKPGES